MLAACVFMAPEARAQIPTIGISGGGVEVDEGDSVTFTLTADVAPTTDLTVNLRLMSSLFLAPGDWGWTTAVIRAGHKSTTYTVDTDDDNYDADRIGDPGSPIEVKLEAGNGYRRDMQSLSAVARVKDNDGPIRVSISGGGITVTEGASVTFTLTADRAPETDLAVKLRVVDVFEFDPDSSRYLARSEEGIKTVIVPAGKTSATYTVHTEDDDEDDDRFDARNTVTVYVQWISGSNRDDYWPQRGKRIATVKVRDNDDGPVSVGISGGYGVTEGDSVTFTVMSDRAPKNDLTVYLTVRDHADDQTPSGDYLAPSQQGTQTVVIPAGERSVTYTVHTVDDDLDDLRTPGTVSVKVNLGPDYNYMTLDGPGNEDLAFAINDRAWATVHDDDDPIIVSISGGSGGTEGDAVEFFIEADPAPTSPLTVTVAVSQDGDFVAADELGQRQVTISVIGSATVTVATANDEVDEPNGSVTATLEAGSYYAPGALSTLTLEVVDNDPTVVSLARTGPDAIEEGDRTAFTVTLGLSLSEGEIIDAPLSVSGAGVTNSDWSLAKKSGVANRGIELLGAGTASPVVRFSGAGARVATLELVAADDGQGESVETFTVALGSDAAFDAAGLGTNVGGGADPHETRNSFDVQVTNPPTVTVSSGPSLVTEGTGAGFTITVWPLPVSPLAVDLTVAEAANGDFVASGDEGERQVSVPASGSLAFTVPTVNDHTDEADGSVTVTLGAVDGYRHGRPASVTVADDDATAVTLTVLESVATEGDAADTAAIALALNRGLVGGERLAVPLQFAGGVPGTDFTLSAPSPLPAGVSFSGTTVTFAGSETGPGAASVTLTLGALVDADTADRTVTVSIPASSTGSAPTLTAVALGGGASGARIGDGQITLEDATSDAPPDVTPEVSISGGASGTEGEAVEFFIAAADPAPASPLAVTVAVSQAGDFVAPGELGRRQVTIPTTGSATVTVATANDEVDEANGSVTATLAAGDGYTLGALSTLTLDVVDDDEPAPVSATAGLTVSLAAERSSIAETKGETRFTIALSRALGAGETAVVPFTVTGGKPRAHWSIRFRGADNGPGVKRTAVGVHSAVTFTEGGRTATLVLMAQPNDDRKDRTIGIAFGTGERAPSASGVEGGITPAGKAIALAIVDDDKPRGLTVSLAAERSSIAEAKGETKLTIALSRALGAGETATVPFTVTGGRPNAHWNIRFRGADNGPGVKRTASGVHSAVTFTEGGRTATLVLMAKPNDDRKARTIGIAFGTGERAPSASGVEGGITPVGKAIAVAIVDDDKPVEPEGLQAPTPVLALAGPGAVTEGASAGFTLTADPSPASDLAVTLRIAQTGDVAPPTALGERTVTMAANTATLAVPVSTAGDATDEPDGALTVTVVAVGGVPVEGGASATVAVTDDDATAVVLSAPTGDIDEAGGRKTLTVTLGRALVAGEALAVPLTLGGAATLGGDYTLTAPSPTPQGVSHAHLAGTDPASIPTLTFTGPSATSATLALTANADTTDEGAGERVTVALGTLAAPGLGGGARGSGSATFSIVEPPPEVSIAAKAPSITEGAAAAFTVSASRAPGTDLTVTLAVSEAAGADFVAADDEGAATVTIAKGATEAVFSVPTVNDTTDEPDGSVTVTVAAPGEGDARYRVAAAPSQSATVAVSDDDVPVPVLSVADATVREGEGLMWFTVRLSAPSERAVKVSYRTRESTPVSAQANVDYLANSWTLDFRAGETEKRVWVYIYDDNHDEGPETFEVVLRSASGAPIGDGVGVGTIVNDDPMPAAWLGRFGRTVAEQALDGIAGRMAAPRTPGMQGTLAGQALTFGAPADGAPGPWSGAGPGGAAVPGGTGALALAAVMRGIDGHGAVGNAGRFGDAGVGHGPESGPGQAVGGTQSHTMTAREALLGSSFTLTGATDAGGGSMAFWGRGSQARFDGREGTFSLDGAVTTGMLGADYARGEWLIGLALTQSTGEGEYRDTEVAPRPASQTCLDGMDAATRALCNGAVREGDGEVEASLTAAIPYASLQASERLKLWGAAGIGSGEVTLETAMGGSYSADTTWRMAAAGLRGDLLAPPESGSGPALALTSDALWARTASEKTRDLAASESDATRLRLGLEGSYRMALEGGGHLTPKLEVGARHDGGDAETGFGIELGGGLAWSDPALGLSLDLSGRTLLSHEDDDLKDRGYAASLGFDPDPATERGPSFALRQEFGARASGGLDALFAPDPPDPLDERPGGEPTSRWTAEAAYGLPAFGGRFTASPNVGLGLSATARDYSLGWRWTPAATAPDLTFGLRATRGESDAAPPEHTVGLEVRARW